MIKRASNIKCIYSLRNSMKRALKEQPGMSVAFEWRESLRNKESVIRARSNYNKNCRISRNSCGLVVVVFIVQYIPAWNKMESVYRSMTKDDRFKTYILCVPNDRSCSPCNNDVYKWFVDRGYKCINSKNEDGSWFELQKLAPEYVFFGRPYNVFMPRPYKSWNVGRYAKICDFLYGFVFSETDMATLINKDFFNDCYTYYACSVDDYRFFWSKIKHSHYQRVKFFGYPGLTNVVEKKSNHGNGAWKSEHKEYRVIWTPRWSTDSVVGGSNFLNYKDDFLKYANDNNDELIIRPHPLAFDNFVKKGQMTAQQVELYRAKCNSMSNVILDEGPEYLDSFWNADVLVTDVSSLVFEFFVTGKPLVFCEADSMFNKDYTSTMREILSASYIAKSFKEVEQYLKMLKQGVDPLKEDRDGIIKKVWGSKLELCPWFILEDLWNDSFSSLWKLT